MRQSGAGGRGTLSSSLWRKTTSSADINVLFIFCKLLFTCFSLGDHNPGLSILETTTRFVNLGDHNLGLSILETTTQICQFCGPQHRFVNLEDYSRRFCVMSGLYSSNNFKFVMFLTICILFIMDRKSYYYMGLHPFYLAIKPLTHLTFGDR